MQELEGHFQLQSMIEPNHYEIHYVFQGAKRVLLHSAGSMTERDAWLLAARDGGISLSGLQSGLAIRALMNAAESQGVTKVRWNHCTRYLR